MKLRLLIVILLTFLFTSLFVNFSSYASGFKSQILETVETIGEKYVEVTEYINVPKPVVPIIPIFIGIAIIALPSFSAMYLTARKKVPTRFYVMGACGGKVECRFSKEIRPEYVKAHLSLGCNQQFDSLTVEDESKSTMLRNVARLCKECGEAFSKKIES